MTRGPTKSLTFYISLTFCRGSYLRNERRLTERARAMGNEIQKRLQTLETQSGVGEDVVRVVLLTFMGAAPEPRAVVRCGGPAWRIDRNPGESKESFYERAAELAPANGIARA